MEKRNRIFFLLIGLVMISLLIMLDSITFGYGDVIGKRSLGDMALYSLQLFSAFIIIYSFKITFKEWTQKGLWKKDLLISFVISGVTLLFFWSQGIFRVVRQINMSVCILEDQALCPHYSVFYYLGNTTPELLNFLLPSFFVGIYLIYLARKGSQIMITQKLSPTLVWIFLTVGIIMVLVGFIPFLLLLHFILYGRFQLF